MKNTPIILFLAVAVLSGKCQDEFPDTNNPSNMQTDADQHRFTNDLIRETSPYLLQHAHNPVKWHAWNEATLQKAKTENKLMLVSIGYSSCHWCHVMERESFEDEEVAKRMNEHFICIKVDREERPDVDQVYINAVQIITGQAGWPLNCFTLPDGRPFYGGTYFNKKNWMTLLENILLEYKENRSKIEEYADRLVRGIKGPEELEVNTVAYHERHLLDLIVEKWKKLFDNKYGGMERSPKFPLPNNYEFLMEYAYLKKDEDIRKHVELTLDEMAFGGIYDQVGGGFARYSTDQFWKVPHFEKMLYDNAQLVALYAKGYRWFKKDLYKEVVFRTLDFVERELDNKAGGYYAALDADSEGEEGAYYIWREDELKSLAGDDFPFVSAWFNIRQEAIWEDGKYVLHRQAGDPELMKDFNLDQQALENKKQTLLRTLSKARNNRERPGTDDKTLTAWNALMITGYAEAYRSFGNKAHLKRAIETGEFIWSRQHSNEGFLYRTFKNGKSAISGFLEDYAHVINAYIALYQVSFDEKWLSRADELVTYCFRNFYKADNSFFYFTPQTSELIARNVELTDNVIPASNSAMANGLFLLGQLLDSARYMETAGKMLDNVAPYMAEYGSSYSNWGLLMLKKAYPFREVAICGPESSTSFSGLAGEFLPNTLFLGSRGESKLPLLENKFVPGKTMIYVCENKTCKLPVQDIEKALQQIGTN